MSSFTTSLNTNAIKYNEHNYFGITVHFKPKTAVTEIILPLWKGMHLNISQIWLLVMVDGCDTLGYISIWKSFLHFFTYKAL